MKACTRAFMNINAIVIHSNYDNTNSKMLKNTYKLWDYVYVCLEECAQGKKRKFDILAFSVFIQYLDII
jgi:hypothetical protein